ncbi:MAG: YraN family protein [Rhizobiaceae bacterium]|jgi:putative endonuclease|nr:YraN family protein [Rhizobiaceae bacterium]
MAAGTRIAAEQRGHVAELRAEFALRLKGWRVLARRWKCPSGEIDLIARRGDLVAIIEVKARRTLVEAMDAVTPSAQRRIMNAAALWHGRQKDATRLSIRFDIIAVPPFPGWPVHVERAFE